MRKIALAIAAVAAFGLAVPSFADTAEARTVTVVKPAHHVVTKSVRDFSARPHRCRVVLVKKRIGHRVVVSKVRRCW